MAFRKKTWGKRCVSVLLSIVFLLNILCSVPVGAINPQPEPPGIQVFIDGAPLTLDMAPQVLQGRTLAPLRAIFEALGATIEWNQAEQSVTAKKGSDSIYIKIGSATARKNNSPITLDVPAQIINSRTLVPLRFVSEALGASVAWDGTNRKVSIISTGSPTPGMSSLTISSGFILPNGRRVGTKLPADLQSFIGDLSSQIPSGSSVGAAASNMPDFSLRANSIDFQPISSTELFISTLPGKPTGTDSHEYVKGNGVFIDWSLADQKWWFKWNARVTGITSVVWQVSMLPFSSSDQWKNPPGLLGSGRLNPNTKEFSIDFADFFAGQSEVNSVWFGKTALTVFKKSLENGLKQGAISAFDKEKMQSALKGVNSNINLAASSSISTVLKTGSAIKTTGQNSDCAICPSSVGIKQLTAGLIPVPSRKYYVRVVPLNAQDKCVGIPSNHRIIEYGRPTITLSNYTNGTYSV